MYSRNKGMTLDESRLTPPPGYDGSRFRTRSDGRDDGYPPYREREETRRRALQRRREIQRAPAPKKDSAEEYCTPLEETDFTCEEECALSPLPDSLEDGCEERKAKKDVLSILEDLKGEEILLVALIIMLSGSLGGAELDTVLILALLLCIS